MNQTKNRIRVALVVPHIFLHQDILPDVIFAPGALALSLASGLTGFDINVTLFTPGPIKTTVTNINADMSYFETELSGRGDSYLDLLKKHPFVFISLARQVQSELIAKAYSMANNNEFDLVHIYTNEEDVALPFAKLCQKPIIFTHHDPFNFMVRYKSVFPKYTGLNWLSISLSQRKTMPRNTNWLGNVYHGLNPDDFCTFSKTGDYIAYIGRIIEPKGLHLAIDSVNLYNKNADKPLKLKIAGKHYGDLVKDTYWQQQIVPRLGGNIEYIGFIDNLKEKNEFLGHAKALIIPSIFDEPFGMVMIEALASGTPIIGLDSGAIPEIVTTKNGILVNKAKSDNLTVERLSTAIGQVNTIDRKLCRKDFETRFTLSQMCEDHANIYKRLTK